LGDEEEEEQREEKEQEEKHLRTRCVLGIEAYSEDEVHHKETDEGEHSEDAAQSEDGPGPAVSQMTWPPKACTNPPTATAPKRKRAVGMDARQEGH
jgi:hypothetical protein